MLPGLDDNSSIRIGLKNVNLVWSVAVFQNHGHVVVIGVGQASNGTAGEVVTFKQKQVASVSLQIELVFTHAIKLPRFVLVFRAHVGKLSAQTLSNVGFNSGNPLLSSSIGVSVKFENSLLPKHGEGEIIWVIRVTRNIAGK